MKITLLQIFYKKIILSQDKMRELDSSELKHGAGADGTTSTYPD